MADDQGGGPDRMRQVIADALRTGRFREADKVNIPNLPDAVRYRNWKVAVREELMGASGRLVEAFAWIRQLDDPAFTYDVLQDSGEFLTLDMKLAAALTAKAFGEIGRKLSLRKEKEYQHGRLVKGRQMLHMIHDFYKVTEEAGALYDFQDLLAAQIKGGST